MFGHDTLCLVQPREYHPNFETFANQLGIIVTGNDYRRDSTSVEVVDSGFLTSYPWKISGTLTSEEKWENQFNWATNKDTIGNYTAKISWYFGDKLVAMD